MKSELSREQMFKVNAILDLIARDFKIPLNILTAPKRGPQKYNLSRSTAAIALREILHLSFKHIGRVMGRDHSTIIHSINVGKRYTWMPEKIAKIDRRLHPWLWPEPFETIIRESVIYGEEWNNGSQR